MAPTIPERIKGYVLPCVLIIVSAACKSPPPKYPKSPLRSRRQSPNQPPSPLLIQQGTAHTSHTTDLLQTALTAPKLLVTDFKAYRSVAFAKFWLALGKKFADKVPAGLPPLLASARGVILDIGPGAGDQLARFSHPENVTAVYGAEPCVELHATLRANAERAGLGGKYRVLSCGAEPESLVPALAKEGLLGKDSDGGGGVFDEVVCVRVLCGVPKLDETVANLYRCLKPGGRFVVCEHVVNDDKEPGGWVGRLFQGFYMALGWPFWGGGCELTRNTEAVLMKAAEVDGGWTQVEMEKVDEWSVVPNIVGYCVKRG
jgi:SAM-dependent methyltransferase